MFEKKTLSDYIYEEILEDIISLNYMPGHRLSDVQLAEKYNVSRAPVRNAIMRLEREGMVVVKPQSSTIVSKISIKMAQDICDVRLLLETYAVRIAAEKITDRQLDDLQAAFDKLEAMDPDSEERSRFISVVDLQMHNLISELCGNQVIPEIIDRYRPEIQRVRRANITWVNRKEPTQMEMQKIFAALKKRDADAAVEAMREHIINIRTAIGNLSLD